MVGSFRHGVDAKGRVALPARLRGSLPEGSVVAKGMEHRLVIWPPDAWQEMDDKLRALRQGSELRQVRRMLFGGVKPLELDSQGRMLLDAEQRQWAEITDQCVFVGLGDCIEIVGAERWDADHKAVDPDTYTRLYDQVTGATPATSTPSA